MKEFFVKLSTKYKHIEDICFHFLKRYMWIIVIALALILSTIGKAFAFPFLSPDYNSFLYHWMTSYKELGIKDGFGASLGDYTPIYNYFLCIFGVTFPESIWVYAIKIFDLLFEISFATAFFFIIYHCSKNLNYSALAGSVALIIPSIIINGAFWGQCDIIYSSFVVWSFYFILTKRYHLSMIFFSIAFAFKLQAIFFFPFLFLLLLKRKVKIYQILYIPIIYIVVALPALICGRSFIDILTVYTKQTGEYSDRISLSAPSLYAFFDNNLTGILSSLPTVLFFVVTLIYVFYLYYKDYELNNENLITFALISVLFSAFFLPYMHERYFFLADLLAFIYVFIKKKGLLICFLINFASIVCCCYFLFGGFNMLTHFNAIRVAAGMNIGAIILLIIELIKIPSKKNIDTNSCN